MSQVNKNVDSDVIVKPPTARNRIGEIEAEIFEYRRIIRQQALELAVKAENAVRLRESRAEVARLENVMDDARKSASEAKKTFDAAVAAHFALEAELDDPQARLPFGAEPAVCPKPQPSEANDNWRKVWVRDLVQYGLSFGIIDRLFETGIKTLGDLSDFTAPDHAGGCRALTDIPGIGSAKAERIEAALDAFWQSRAAEEEILAGVEEVEKQRESEPIDPADDVDPYEDAGNDDEDRFDSAYEDDDLHYDEPLDS